MKTKFPGFYIDQSGALDVTSAEFMVAFYANVLLSVHRYPAAAANDILNVMQALQDKVWLPYQAALEYQRNRLSVIADQNRKFEEVKKIIDEGTTKIENSLVQLQLKKRHSTIDITDYLSKLKNEKDGLIQALQSQKDSHPDVTDVDPIRDRLDGIFGNYVGDPPENQGWLDSIAAEGEKRFESKIPPGYKDLAKKGEVFVHGGFLYRREYGDLILWKQLIQWCKTKGKRQVVFVTDDEKEDWWWSVESGGTKRLGPRPELTDELGREANIEHFWLLSSERFVQYFAKALNLQLAASTLQQVRDIKASLIAPESVKCPSCGLICEEQLGVSVGSSAIHYCDGCASRFHIHRGADGHVFTREWGGMSQVSRFRVEAVCPKCGDTVPANLSQGEDRADRYCMNCCSLLTIDASGKVLTSRSAAPEVAKSVTLEGRSTFLGCPKCAEQDHIRTIWGNGELIRAVCPDCHTLIEARRG